MIQYKTLTALFICTFGLLALFAQEERGVVVLDQPAPSSLRRTALIIGNGDYAAGALQNPVNDARDLARALARLDFQVQLLSNADRRSMLRGIRDFGDSLKANGGVGLFFFAGHGMQVNGQNFLIPVAADIRDELDIEFEGVQLGRLLGKMASAENTVNIVILDACRNNPFARGFRSASSGLASVDAPQGTLIAYATAPGSVAADGAGRNSPFTAALLNHVERSGIKVEDVFKRVRADVLQSTDGRQVPWESSSLIGDFYFLKDAAHKLRSRPQPNLTDGAVEAMLQINDFFCHPIPPSYSIENALGKGFPNDFSVVNDSIVMDRASGLMWQRRNAAFSMQFDDARRYIEMLNRAGWGGFGDWRLPTLEEAMTLMDTMLSENEMYIASLFDSPQQLYIWTSDGFSNDVWVVFYALGYCRRVAYDDDAQVLAVRSRD